MKKVFYITATIIPLLTLNTYARYYDPSLGRFLNPDSIVPSATDPQSLNRYAYVRNNPIVLTDSTGHSWLSTQIHKINHWADKNPWGALIIQQFDPIIGSALLDRSATGRNILAGEIVLGTTIGTAGIGGVAWAPVWSGALSGELIGGYSAYRSGGSVLSGVSVGGIVGAGTGYLGAQAGFATRTAMGSTQFGYIAGGAVRGAIIGAGAGGTAGYRGGRGNLQSEWAGIYRGAAVGALAGGTMGYYQAPGGSNLDMSPDEALNHVKTDVMRAAQDAAQNHSANPLSEVLQNVAKDFGPRALNSLAENHPEVAYSLVYDVSGLAEIYHENVDNYLYDHGISGNKKIKF